MAKAKKAATTTTAEEEARKAVSTAQVTERRAPRPWQHGAAPWESYGPSAAELTKGLQDLVEQDGDTEVVISTIEDLGKGKFKVTHPKVGAPAGDEVREAQDGMLAYRTGPRRGKAKDVPLTESFDLGGEEGGRVVFAADAFYYILLTDDMKYRAMQNSYRMFRENPLYRAIVLAKMNFVMGKGLQFKALDEDPAVNDYVQEFWTVNKMVGKDVELAKRHYLTGEMCAVLYKKGRNGVSAKHIAVRLIPFWRLAEVLKDDQDAENIVGFRVWRAAGPYRPQISEDIFKPEEVLFWKSSTPEEDRGEPPLLAAMRPCVWYEDWITNRVVLNRFRTAIVLFKKIIKGTPGKVAAVSANDPSSTPNHQGTGGKLEKRLPKFGSVVTHNDSIEYEWKAPNLQAGDAGHDGRLILLYALMSAQIPEFVIGDVSNANLASQFVAESPFIRAIEAEREYFQGFFQELFRIAIQHGIDTGQLPKFSTETTLSEGNALVRFVRKAMKGLGIREADYTDDGQKKSVRKIPTRTDVAIEWPNLLHSDVLEEAQALQIHQQLGIVSKETLAGKAGYDWQVEKPRLEEEAQDDLDQFAAQRQAELDAADAAGGQDDPATPAKGAKRGKAGASRAERGTGGPDGQGVGKV